jgi:hypothetical protein
MHIRRHRPKEETDTKSTVGKRGGRPKIQIENRAVRDLVAAGPDAAHIMHRDEEAPVPARDLSSLQKKGERAYP